MNPFKPGDKVESIEFETVLLKTNNIYTVVSVDEGYIYLDVGARMPLDYPWDLFEMVEEAGSNVRH